MDKHKYNQRASLPYEQKLILTRARIRDWYNAHNGEVYVSFSGGRDSCVLLDIVRDMYADVPAVFCDTGLEFPEIREHVQLIEDVIWIRPRIPFTEVLTRYGYPVVSKEVSEIVYDIRHSQSAKLMAKRLAQLPKKWSFLLDAPFEISEQCCGALKKRPMISYEKQTGRVVMLGTRVAESRLRMASYMRYGCNAFLPHRSRSMPLAVWNDADIARYIEERSLSISAIYSMGYPQTGCAFCMYGCYPGGRSCEKFEMLLRTHPRLYRYCDERLGIMRVLDYLWKNMKGEPYHGDTDAPK